MQHQFSRAERALYDAHVQGDHDFETWAEVLTMSERPVGDVDLLDGQVNLNDDDGPERTASLTLSDPEHALSFGANLARDDGGELWVNRLLRVRHRVEVPGLGPVVSTPFVGAPTAVGRQGAELSLELGDKSLLADHGTREKTYKKGWNAANSIRAILRDMTGERRLRIPNHRKKLSRPYTVGMADEDVTPWAVAKRIAGRELGWRLFYSADGYATAGPSRSSRGRFRVESMLALPDTQTSFTDFRNYARVNTKRTIDRKKKRDIYYWWTGTAALRSSHDLSARGLARNGVERLLPIVVDDDDLKTRKQVGQRASSLLNANSDLGYDSGYEVVPVYHLDNGDYLVLPDGVGAVPWVEGSIPLGTGGSMTVGTRRWVSRPVVVSRRAAQRKKLEKKKKKKKGKGG
jgi:hypothetical protein